jgi:hypothetical protein
MTSGFPETCRWSRPAAIAALLANDESWPAWREGSEFRAIRNLSRPPSGDR